MAKYTFEQACLKDTFTKLVTGSTEIAAVLPLAGRLLVQDTADADPTTDQTGSIPVGEDYPINLAVTGLEVFYMPYGKDVTVYGMKK